MAPSFSPSKHFPDNQLWLTQLPEQKQLIVADPKSQQKWFIHQKQSIVGNLENSIEEIYQLVPKKPFPPTSAESLLQKISDNKDSRRDLFKKLDTLTWELHPTIKRIQYISALNLDTSFQTQPNSSQVDKTMQPSCLVESLTLPTSSQSELFENLTKKLLQTWTQFASLNNALEWVEAPLQCMNTYQQLFPENAMVSIPPDTLKLMRLTIQGVPIQHPCPLEKGTYGVIEKTSLGDNTYAKKTCNKNVASNSCLLSEKCAYMAIPPHPNLVSLRAMRSQELWLELMVGGTLENEFNFNLSLTIQQLLGYFLDISKALLHLHTHGFTHKDVKPDNVLIDNSKTAKLCDLGLTVSTRTDNNCAGTPDYAAPEIWMAQTPFSTKVDCWSFGVMMYEMLTGKLPFCDDTQSTVQQLHMTCCKDTILSDLHTTQISHTKKLRENNDLFSKVKEIIEGCLHGDPQTRLSMQQVRDALMGCLDLCGKEL